MSAVNTGQGAGAGKLWLLLLLRVVAARRGALMVLSVVILLLAAALVPRMPLQLLPEIQYPQIRIISDLPGQTSGVVEETINEPIEAELAGMPGLVRMESRSGDGRSYIELFFNPGYDLDRALRDATQAVQRAQARIPDTVPPPRIFEVTTTQEPAMQIAFGSSALSAPEIRQRLRTYVLPRISAVNGVETVYMGREEIPELVVEVDPYSAAALGVSLLELEAVLLDATQPPLSSTMRSASFEGVGVFGDEGWSPARLAARVLTLNNGAVTLPLSQVANVYYGGSEERVRTRLDGAPAVLLSVHRSSQAQSLNLAAEVRAIIEEVAASNAFADIEASVLFDDAVVTRTAVQSVLTAAIGGSLLAMLLIFFTLRNRRYVPLVALLVAVSLSAGVIVLYAAGQSLNLLTLAGLLLSVGLGLDYAIVYFDRLDRLRGVDEPHLYALLDVAGPLLGALLTTLAAVTPFLFVDGLIALLFRPLIVTVIVCALFSFIFALLLLPSFARQRVFTDVTEPEEPPQRSGAWWRRAQGPLPAWSMVIVLVAVIVLLGRQLPFDVLPVVDDGFVDVRITHPVGIPADDMDRIARQVETRILATPGTDAVMTTVGGYFREGLPAFRPGTSDFTVRVDTAVIASRDWADAARASIAALDLAELNVSITPPRIRGVQTRLADADLIVVLARQDGDILALAPTEVQVQQALTAVDGLGGVRRMRSGVSPRWQAEPDYAALASYGLLPGDLRKVINYALEGQVLRQRVQNGEPLQLRVRYDRQVAGGPQQLPALPLRSATGHQLLLDSAVSFRLLEEPTHIERREGQRVVRIAGDIDAAGPGLAATVAEVDAVMRNLDLDAGVSWWLEGEIEALEETQRTFSIALVLALLMVLTLLSIQYGRMSYALAGLLVIPLTGAGTVMLLSLMGRSLDAMVLAGVVIAVGIVANNMILVLSQTLNATLGPQGLDIAEAASRAARDRFRPILLTVASTVIGISPLLFGGAEVFGLLQPLAIALTGTLLLSIPLACLVLPGILASGRLLSQRR